MKCLSRQVCQISLYCKRHSRVMLLFSKPLDSATAVWGMRVEGLRVACRADSRWNSELLSYFIGNNNTNLLRYVTSTIVTPWSESVSELCRPSGRHLSAKLVPTFANRGVSHSQRGGSLQPYSRVSTKQLSFQVSPQLYSRGWVDTVPDLLLFRESGNTKNQTQNSGSVARNVDH
jgi:hypothetical protein